MHIALWIIAGLFGAGFILGGIAKLVMPHERYAAKLGWPEDFTPGAITFMGIVEIVGGLGLILPGVLGIAPILVPVAASGMALYMAGAGTERVRRAEYLQLLGDLVFLAAMLVVAWGRFAVVPLS